MNDLQSCREWFKEGITRFGVSNVDYVVKENNRRRVERDNPKLRKSYRWSEYKRLYQRDHGICGICGREMALIRGTIHMDHKNPDLPVDSFEAEWNRQVVHKACNLHKGPMSIAKQAKEYGRTYVQLTGESDGQ